MNRALACLASTLLPGSAALAGPLTPPAGPVAPTGRLGPRTEVNAQNTPGDIDSRFKIIQPGSYYLPGNITGVAGAHGIEIAASGVTLDLMGFELRGVPGSLDGINVSLASRNVHIHRGSLRDWDGAGADALNAVNSSLCNILAADNGEDGLSIGAGGLVDRCAALGNGATGIQGAGGPASIRACTAQSNGRDGIQASLGSTIIGSTASVNGSVGINAAAGSTISACAALSNSLGGIYAASGSTIAGCAAFGNGVAGISVASGSMVSACSAQGNDGDGIVAGDRSQVRDSAAGTNAGRGIEAGSSSAVLGATASFNNGIGVLVGDDSRVQGCIANANGVNGIELSTGASALHCTASANTFDGVHSFSRATIEGCQTVDNGRDGIRIGSFGVVRNNVCHNNGVYDLFGSGSGIHATGTDNRIDGNTITRHFRGVYVTADDNLIIRNTAGDNITHFDVAAGNAEGWTISITGQTLGAFVSEGNGFWAGPWVNFTD